MINPNPDQSGAPTIDALTGLPTTNTAVIDSSLIDMPITINPPLTNISLGDVLNALVLVAPKPIHYSVEDYAIVFSAGKPLPLLYARHFRVDAKKFMAAMQKVPGIKTNNLSAMARDFFRTLGVDLNVPGKSVFFNDGLGELFVRATANDLDTVENALEAVTAVAPQIHIKAYFMEVPKGTLSGFGLERVISVTNQTVQSNQVAGLVGIHHQRTPNTNAGDSNYLGSHRFYISEKRCDLNRFNRASNEQSGNRSGIGCRAVCVVRRLHDQPESHSVVGGISGLRQTTR